MQNQNNKTFHIIFIGFIIANITLIFLSRLLPMNDLPQHLAYATIHKYIGEPDNYFSTYFKTYPLFMKWNSLHPFFCGLNIWPSIEFGNKVFISVYIILLPLSVLYFIKKINGNIWFSLLSFLLIYNFSFIWGNVGFFFAIPFCIFQVYFNFKYIKSKNLLYGIVLILNSLLIFHSHILPFVITSILILAHNILINRKSTSSILKQIYPYIFNIFLTFYFIIFFNKGLTVRSNKEEQVVNTITKIYSFDKIKDIPTRFMSLFQENFSYLDNTTFIKIVSFFISIIFILIFALSFKSTKNCKNLELKNYYFFYPGIPWDWSRYSVFIYVFIIVYSSICIFKINNILKIISICLLIFHFSLIISFFNEFNNENIDFNKKLLENIPGNKILASLTIDDVFRGKHMQVQYLPEYHIVWNKGIQTLRLASNGYPFYQMYRKVNRTILPDSDEFVGSFPVYYGHYNNVDYLLIKGSLNDFVDPLCKNIILRDFNIHKIQGKWLLLKHK